MLGDARDMAAFYATPLGGLAARLLRGKLAGLWPAARNLSILGLGHATPYLQLWRQEAAHCIALSPRQLGPQPPPWPPGRASLACLGEDGALPFADLSFDRILLVHGLEQAENARHLLRQCWRLLKDDGRLIVVAPNRRGLWALAETTPFGAGQPYSPGQLRRLLESLFFHVEREDALLFTPPLHWRLNLSLARYWERTGSAMVPQFAGLVAMEATKDLHGVVPLQRQRAGRRVMVEA